MATDATIELFVQCLRRTGPKAWTLEGVRSIRKSTWCTGQCTPCTPPSPAPLRFVRGYVMVRLTSLTLPVYFVNINGACPPSTLYTPHSSLLTHTHTHAHLHSLFPSLPLSPSPSFSFCLSLTHTHRTKCCWMATFDVVAGVALTLPSGGYTRCHTLTHTHTHGHTHTPTHRAVAGSRLIDWF